MVSFTEKQKRWKTYTSVLMWCMFVFIFGNAISSVLDIMDAIMSFVSQILNIFDEGEVPTEIINFMSWGYIAKIILFISYGAFIWGTSKLKGLLPEDSASWKKVRTAFILLLVGAFVSWALHFLPVINLLGYFICWLLSVIAFCKQKNAFGKLSNSGHYSRGASEGFNHLKNVADSNLALHTWIPLGTIITLALVGGSSISNIASSGGLKDLEQSLYSTYAGFALVGIVWGFIIALTILHIFFANIIGWIKVKCGNLVETEVQEETQQNEPLQSGTEESHLDSETKEQETSQANDFDPAKTSVQETTECKSEDTTKGTSKHRKSKMLVGGAIFLVLIGCSLLYFSGGGNSPLNLPSPQWKKFVVPTTDGVKAYKEPNKGSLVLCMADEQLASETALSEYCWSDRKPNKDWSVMEWKFGTQDILPVLEETDGWYKVFIQLERGWTSYCGEPAIAYIEKSSVKEIVPKTITAKILEEKLPGSVKNVIASGKLKDLCLINDDSNFEMDDAYLLMGELKNNSLVVFTTSYKMDYIEDGKPIEINPDTESRKKRNILTFNKSKSFPHEYLGVSLLDVRKLTDEEIERLISAEDYKSKVMTAYYYFSEVDAFKRYPVQPKE